MVKFEKSLKVKEIHVRTPRSINGDFKLLTSYLKVGNFFGITYFYGNTSYYFKIFGSLLTILLAVVAFYSLKVQRIIYKDLHPTIQGMSLVLTVSDSLFIFYFLVSLMVRKRKHWNKLFETIHMFESILNTYEYLENGKMWKIILKLLLIFTTILHTLYSLYYYTFKVIFKEFQMILILRGLTNLFLIFITTYYLTLTHWLDNRYTFMCKYLKMMRNKPGYVVIIRKVITTFKLAETIVDKTNHLYGSILFASLTLCIINILYYFVLALDLTSISLEVKGINYLAPLIYVIFLLVLTMSCNTVEINGHSFINTCYFLHESTESDIERDHLMLLVKYIEEWRPIFSAAGFYDVNQSSLSSIFSVIVTNLVIAIQFNMVLS